jgi:molybdopterin synthase sulfur carrier subunit
MTVHVEFYSRLREIAGTPSLAMTLPEGATVDGLVTELCRDHPQLRDFEKSMLFGIGVEFVEKDEPLKNGDVIAIMPPVQGG